MSYMKTNALDSCHGVNQALLYSSGKFYSKLPSARVDIMFDGAVCFRIELSAHAPRLGRFGRSDFPHFVSRPVLQGSETIVPTNEALKWMPQVLPLCATRSGREDTQTNSRVSAF